VTAISRRRSTMANDYLEYTRSAPSSPTLNHTVRQGSSHNQISSHPSENVGLNINSSSKIESSICVRRCRTKWCSQ
jgi:hypothetical protein